MMYILEQCNTRTIPLTREGKREVMHISVMQLSKGTEMTYPSSFVTVKEDEKTASKKKIPPEVTTVLEKGHDVMSAGLSEKLHHKREVDHIKELVKCTKPSATFLYRMKPPKLEESKRQPEEFLFKKEKCEISFEREKLTTMPDPATLISGLLSNLVPLIKDQFKLIYGFDEEVEKLLGTLSAINAALEDAEIKNVWNKDRQTEDWLRKLKRVAYEVRDIMDECTFEDLRLQVKRRNASSSTRIQVTNCIPLPFSNTWSRREIGYKIKDVQGKLEQFYSERKNLQLREPIHDSKIINKFTSSWRETMSLSSSPVLYGRDKEKKEIIDILLNNNTSSTDSVATELLYVLPIVGIGGLGKTTLAQMVYNDHEVSKHFDLKFWVCVSDEFNIELVIKAIIGANNETSLEILKDSIQNKLRGKRYLIVLDDVWNENVCAWDQLRSILDCGANGAFVLTTTRKRRVAEIMKTIPHFELPSLTDDDCWLLFKKRAFEDGKPKDSNFINIGKQIANKCKGVPLIAKTLGSQLTFCDDEKEWQRIKDSEIWENEEDLMPILRLSYYDLSYQLRICFAFCAIFPKDTEIEKEKLIQLWMAHGLIPPVQKQEVEDVGNRIWKELCWRSFFQDEKERKHLNGTVYTVCMMHDLMHDLSQSVMQDECYTLNAKRSSDGLGREVRHVTIMVKQLDPISLSSLKEIGGLQSIMFNGTYYNRNGRKDILSVLKELLHLRVLKLRHNVQYQDLSYVSRLKHLRYLDISYSWITILPNSICDLFNLQTLILNNCSDLKSLPKNMSNLINLRHLYLDDCYALKYMPRGMGQLKHLKTLSLFVIGEKKDHCQLDEIRELDIGGCLKIANLGRVSDASIARGINMDKKWSITTLELKWGYDADADGHEKICEALEFSTERLKILKMIGYKGVNILPKWVGKSSPSVTRLERMDNDSEMIVLFPNLCKLYIKDCPKLGALPVPHLKALKDVIVVGECSDELLYSISNLSALTRIFLGFMVERSVLFGAGYMDNNNNNEAQLGGGGVRSTFQSLQSLSIIRCKKLRRLFDEGMIMAARSNKSTRLVTNLMNSLTELEIRNCPELMISVEEFGNLNSLQRLTIENCPKLVFSEDVMALLRLLRARLDYFHVDIELEKEKGEHSRA
ncbi:putative disease resistance protein RGA3 [Impatiens glandulifera]|uniref:putative disease resistance protein RGA3 n=1 Tax=Impatiens glandulifera TaxID=253017 RepID=UPI001FB10443|nr:putative disease resistance protein RGA3 [Impatiens glandulifera]